jgi:uncharacterized protein with PIN domain
MNYQPQAAPVKPCPECGGPRIVTVSFEASLARDGAMGRTHISDCFGVVCIQCGHITWYAQDLQKIRQELEKHPQDFQRAANKFLQQRN